MAGLAWFGPEALLVGFKLLVVTVSSVVSNTVTTAAFLPVAIGAADRARVPRGRLLMPVAFASMLGGTVTLVGTSTNLVVSSLVERSGLPGIGFGEPTPVSLPIALVGVALVVVLGRWLLPVRPDPADGEDLPARNTRSPSPCVTSESGFPANGEPGTTTTSARSVRDAGRALRRVGLCGLLAMIATRCVDARTPFRVDWRVALLIACMLSLGMAMEVTGAGAYLGSLLLPVAHHLGPRGVLLALMLVTVALSAPMSNQAAAAVLLPVALGIAQQLGVAPRPFAVGVCLAASCSFMTPLEPSCVLVYGPGRYRFADFLRLGTPLTAVILALLTVLIPLRWPF